LTNAGHISYIELDGDPLENLSAFEKIVRCMKESGIGYGAINHPVDRDPCCGYTGIIGEVCPCCGRSEHNAAVAFDRIRRITGYLVGTLDRFNNGKRAEEHDRIKHTI
jgi:ribonucleoside-triphosphate reductase